MLELGEGVRRSIVDCSLSFVEEWDPSLKGLDFLHAVYSRFGRVDLSGVNIHELPPSRFNLRSDDVILLGSGFRGKRLLDPPVGEPIFFRLNGTKHPWTHSGIVMPFGHCALPHHIDGNFERREVFVTRLGDMLAHYAVVNVADFGP